MDPPPGIRTVDGDQNRPLVLGIIGPHAVHGVSAERLAIYQTAWIGFVSWILLYDLTVQDREVNFVKCELIILSLFVSMIANVYPIGSNCLDDVIDIHAGFTHAV